MRLILALMASTAIVSWGGTYRPASAQEATVSYSVPAGPLGSAITRFGESSGLQILYPADLVRGKQSPGVSGSLTPNEALARLLVGSGLTYQYTAANTVTIVPPSTSAEVSEMPDGSIMLDTIVIHGAGGLTEGTGSFTTGSTSAATGLDLSLRETPQSVSVITSERMEKQQLNSWLDVAKQTTGIYVSQAGPQIGSTTSVYSRGFTVGNYQIDGGASAGGALQENEQGGIDTAIYDSFTVVRGAAGLLTGSGDPSASVNMSHKRPTRDLQSSVTLGFGRWGKRRAVADISGPLNTSGSIRGRLIGAYDEGGYWAENYRGEKGVLYGSVEADVTDRTLLQFSLEYGREYANIEDAGGMAELFYTDGTLTPFDRYDMHFPEWAYHKRKRLIFGADVEHRFNEGWGIKFSYSRAHRDRDDIEARLGQVRPDNTFGYMWGYYDKREYDTDAATLRLNGRFDFIGRMHDIVAGWDGTRTEWGSLESASGQFYDLAYLNPDGSIYAPEPDWDSFADPVPQSQFKLKKSGYFVATRLRPADNFSFIIGGRWSNYTQTAHYPDGRSAVSTDYKNVFTPYAGAIWDFSKNLTAYASYTEIFRPQSSKDLNGNYLEPEQGKNYEIGIKGEWFDGMFNTSVVAFKSGKDNLAVLDEDHRTPDGYYAYRAESDTTVKGFEFEVSGEIQRGWNIQAGYSYAVRRDFEGKLLNTYVPTRTFKLFTSYTLDSMPQLALGAGLRYQNRIWSNSTSYTDAQRPFVTQPSYYIVDVMANYEINDSAVLTVGVNNLFNKEYRTSATTHSYGPERNVMVTLNYRF